MSDVHVFVYKVNRKLIPHLDNVLMSVIYELQLFYLNLTVFNNLGI